MPCCRDLLVSMAISTACTEGGPSASTGFHGALHLLYHHFTVYYLKTKLKHIKIKTHRNTKVVSNLIENKGETKRKPYFCFALKPLGKMPA